MGVVFSKASQGPEQPQVVILFIDAQTAADQLPQYRLTPFAGVGFLIGILILDHTSVSHFLYWKPNPSYYLNFKPWDLTPVEPMVKSGS